jgi:hypothetical protein
VEAMFSADAVLCRERSKLIKQFDEMQQERKEDEFRDPSPGIE